MPDYLEEAASALRTALADHERGYRPYQKADPGDAKFKELVDGRIRLAKEFAALAAIDKGMLPAELTRELMRAMLVRLSREPATDA